MPKVSRQPLTTAELVTLDDTKELWHETDIAALKGKFVRLKPASTTTDADIKAMKKAVLKAGALAVRTMPKPPADKVQLGKSAELVKGMMVKNDALPPIRFLMRTLVDGSTSVHKNELNDLLDKLADEEGL